MPRKTTNDPKAAVRAAELVESMVAETNGGDAVAAFDAAEFETTTSKVGGVPLTLRRVVLTGPWEVVKGQ